jgi:hypothetical protein
VLSQITIRVEEKLLGLRSDDLSRICSNVRYGRPPDSLTSTSHDFVVMYSTVNLSLVGPLRFSSARSFWMGTSLAFFLLVHPSCARFSFTTSSLIACTLTDSMVCRQLFPVHSSKLVSETFQYSSTCAHTYFVFRRIALG